MIRKLKILGLALVAVLAMSAVGASAASATVEFHSEKAPVVLTGAQEGESNAFDVQFGETKCKTVKYNGTTAVTTATTITLTPTYENCVFAGVASVVHMNGCDFLFHVNNAGPPYTGLVDIVCPAGQEITETAGTKCTIHIPAQTGLGPITYTNIGEGETREITLDLGGITNLFYRQTTGTGAVHCSTIETNAGRMTGTAIVTGENEAGTTHTGIWVA